MGYQLSIVCDGTMGGPPSVLFSEKVGGTPEMLFEVTVCGLPIVVFDSTKRPPRELGSFLRFFEGSNGVGYAWDR